MFVKFKNIINLICKYFKNTKLLIRNKIGLHEHSFNGGGNITEAKIYVNGKLLFHITTNDQILILSLDESYKLKYAITYKRKENKIIITKSIDNDIIINDFKKMSFNPQINWQIYYMLILLNNSLLEQIKKYVHKMIDFYCNKFPEYNNLMNCLILFTCKTDFQGDCILNTYCLMKDNMKWFNDINNDTNEIVKFKKYEFDYLIDKNNPKFKNIINDTNILVFKDIIKGPVDGKYLTLEYKLYGKNFDDYHIIIGKIIKGNLYICDTNDNLSFFDAYDIKNYKNYFDKYGAVEVLYNKKTLVYFEKNEYEMLVNNSKRIDNSNKYDNDLVNDSEEELNGGLIIKWNYAFIIMFLVLIIIIVIIVAVIVVKNIKNNKNIWNNNL